MAEGGNGAERLRRVARAILRTADDVESHTAARADLDALIAELVGAQREVFGPRPRASRGHGARAKLLAYLKAHVGEVVAGEELAAASGIHEWARRVRELRVEHGYAITELGQSLYRLETSDPDAEKAAQWRLANAIRNEKGSARARIGRFLEANVGKVVTREQIDYVGDIAEGIRRVRELRDESGWPIDSHIDDPTLRPGEYRLLSADPADRRDPLQRLYPESLRQKVFERDNYTCQECGKNREKAEAAGDRRFYLEVHHKVAISDELAALPKTQRNDPDNLVTLCHADHLKETAKLQERRRTRRHQRPEAP